MLPQTYPVVLALIGVHALFANIVSLVMGFRRIKTFTADFMEKNFREEHDAAFPKDEQGN